MLYVVLFIAGIAIVLWSAERVTEGVVGAAASFAVSAFFVGALVSGFEPENLLTGLVANFAGLPQVALGTVIGSALFMLLGGFGAALVIVPMAVEVPRGGVMVMLASILLFGLAFFNDGIVSRLEGFLLVLGCGALMFRLYKTAPLLLEHSAAEIEKPNRRRALFLIALGIAGTVVGAELLVEGARGIIRSFALSETFVGMAVVGLGESLEETARMVAPARRGRHDVALGNVVGTTVALSTLNLGLIALVSPITADPWVLRFHAPYLVACAVVVGILLLALKRLGRWVGGLLILLYVVYLGVNLRYL